MINKLQAQIVGIFLKKSKLPPNRPDLLDYLGAFYPKMFFSNKASASFALMTMYINRLFDSFLW